MWEALEDEDFLMKLGAVGIGSDGKKHSTSAGPLMLEMSMTSCGSIMPISLIIRDSTTPIPAGQTALSPPPGIGTATFMTSISAFTTS